MDYCSNLSRSTTNALGYGLRVLYDARILGHIMVITYNLWFTNIALEAWSMVLHWR